MDVSMSDESLAQPHTDIETDIERARSADPAYVHGRGAEFAQVTGAVNWARTPRVDLAS